MNLSKSLVQALAVCAELIAGRSAGLVILNGDPPINVRAFASVRYTPRSGEITYREARNL